jgi:mRNA interferase HigB
MHIITKKVLVEFWTVHPDAEPALRSWLSTMKRGNFDSPQKVRDVFASASFLPKNVVVFNIGRGKGYRLIVNMRYPKRVYVRKMLTHEEYERHTRAGTL